MFRLPKNSNQSPTTKVTGPSQKKRGLCKYPHRKCNLLSLDNYDFCLKHILEDKSAPYKPCPFLYTVSGKKCGKPAHRPDRKDTWFCAEHSHKTNLLRQKATSRHAPPQTQETLLASLAHYARADETDAVKKEESENEDSAKKTESVNPFVDVDAAQVNARCSQVLDFASESDSDVEAAMLDSVWRAQDHESSDAESVDSQAEDPLKHAGVYTAEEVTTIVKEKMIRLQSLYIDQFRRLHHLLKERRRKYLHALKKEKETLCSIHDQEKTTAKEQKLYQKLKALNHFHKYYGEEAILHKKSLDRRAQVTEGTLARISHKGKCAFTEGGVKCGAKTLPGTKYCRKHILEDTQQVLFRACGFKRDDHTCQEPTLNVFENATCVYHITLPAHPHNSLDMTEIKGDIKEERGPIENIHEELVAGSSIMNVERSELPIQEDVLRAVEPVMSMLTEPNSSGLKPLKLENSVDTSVEEPGSAMEHSAVPVLKSEEMVISENVEMATAVTTTVTTDSTVQKMDIHSEDLNSYNQEMLKQESSADDLVMVDMMTDVGVVEEVLETENKTECNESMQLEEIKTKCDDSMQHEAEHVDVDVSKSDDIGNV